MSRVLLPVFLPVAISGVLLVPTAALAASLAVANSGFEEPALADGTSLATIGSPWVFSAGTGVPYPLFENPAGSGVGVVDGEQRIRLRTSSTGSASGIQQALAATYLPNTTYVFAITPIDFDGSSIPQFQILLNGLAAKTVRSDELIGALGREVAVSATLLPGDPLIGQNVTISILIAGQGFNYGAVSFDRARVWAIPIPEPSVALLLGLGLAGIALTSRAGTRSAMCRPAPAGSPARPWESRR